MKFTPVKGLVRVAMVTAGVIVGWPLTESFIFFVACGLLCTGWVIYWLVAGFFDID